MGTDERGLKFAWERYESKRVKVLGILLKEIQYY